MYRQAVLRSAAAVYNGMNGLYLYPRYAHEASAPTLPWLLRYSSTWPLLMTAVGVMVSLQTPPHPTSPLVRRPTPLLGSALEFPPASRPADAHHDTHSSDSGLNCLPLCFCLQH